MRYREKKKNGEGGGGEGEQSNERPTEFVCALHFTFSAIYNKDDDGGAQRGVCGVKKGKREWGYALAPSAYQFYDRSYLAHLQPFSQPA